MTRSVSEMESATERFGWLRWNSHSSSGTRRPPGPVDAPIASVPCSSPVSSCASSCSSCCSTCSIRCARLYRTTPASVGSTRRPERSSKRRPRRSSSERICRLIAGWVTPSRSAACEKLFFSTTATKAASCLVSISIHYGRRNELLRGVPRRPSKNRSMAVRVVLAATATLLLAAPAWGQGSARIAALQTTLTAKGIYSGTIDGVNGPSTRAAVRRFQRRVGLQVDGVVGPRTRRALGRFARHPIGSRMLHRGNVGWDVAALQFQLAWHGFPSRTFDGVFGPRVDNAVRGFQEWAGLTADGHAGPATWRALREPPAHCPIRLGW